MGVASLSRTEPDMSRKCPVNGWPRTRPDIGRTCLLSSGPDQGRTCPEQSPGHPNPLGLGVRCLGTVSAGESTGEQQQERRESRNAEEDGSGSEGAVVRRVGGFRPQPDTSKRPPWFSVPGFLFEDRRLGGCRHDAQANRKESCGFHLYPP